MPVGGIGINGKKIEKSFQAVFQVSSAAACAPPSEVKIAPARATLNPCPCTRTVAGRPEVMPMRFAGTELLIASLFGAWNSACPSPDTIRGRIMPKSDALCEVWISFAPQCNLSFFAGTKNPSFLKSKNLHRHLLASHPVFPD